VDVYGNEGTQVTHLDEVVHGPIEFRESSNRGQRWMIIQFRKER